MPGAIHAITMPRWGMTMTEGLVGAWLVEVGAPVRLGQEILEIETEKIANAYEATSQGTLRRKIVDSSTTIEVGALLGLIADETVSEAELDRFAAEFNSARQSLDRTELAQPTARAVGIGSGSLNVLSLGEGSGIPAVLVHGFGGDLNSWALTQSELGATRVVHAMDLPAHGGSTIPAEPVTVELLARSVSEALDVIGVSRAHWMGHSLGRS